MLSIYLQIILIIFCLLLLFFFTRNVRNYKLELKYALIWFFIIIVSLFMAVFPEFLNFAANLLFIKEPINALFFLAIIFNLLIVYSLTNALSRASTNIKKLSQELGILNEKIEKLENSKNEKNVDK